MTHIMTEKEKLEIVERKLEHQKIRLELKEKRLVILDLLLKSTEEEHSLEQQRKLVELSEKKLNVIEREGKLKGARKHSILVQIAQLVSILSSTTVDIEGTMFPSEPKYKPIMEEEECEIIRKKIMDLIGQL